MLKQCFAILAVILLCGCMDSRHGLKATDTIHSEVNATDTSGQKPVPAQQLILPGQSVGNTSINENADTVFRALGKPDVSDAAMGKLLATWYAKHDTTDYQTQIFFARKMGTADEVSRVKQIRITSPYFKTMDYMSTGMHLQTIDVKKEFNLKKIGQYTANHKQFSVYDDADAGIAFEINDVRICTGIIIHEPRESVISYLALHPNMQMIDK